jgi:hypothetical protein
MSGAIQQRSSATATRWIGGEAPVPALSAGGFLAAVRRTGRATSTASGSPWAHRVEGRIRLRARAASAGCEVPARERRAGVHRRPPSVQSCCVLTGPLRPVDGFPVLPGGALLPRLLRVLRHAPTATADGAPAPSPKTWRAPPGRFPRSLIDRSAGSATSCTPGTSPRATATRHAASTARTENGRPRRSRTATGIERPNSP